MVSKMMFGRGRAHLDVRVYVPKTSTNKNSEERDSELVSRMIEEMKRLVQQLLPALALFINQTVVLLCCSSLYNG